MNRLQELKIGSVKGIMNGFQTLIRLKINDNSHRLIGQPYSYDIQDNIDYKKSRRAEKRVREYFIKIMKKQNSNKKKVGTGYKSESCQPS
jgi:hypothetical protein